MHSYGLEHRARVAMLLGVASVLLAWAWGWVQSACGFSIPWWFDSPSIFGIYGLLFLGLDRGLWRLPALGRALGVPDLRGTWVGSACSNHDNFATEHPVRVVIRQTWTGLLVVLESNGSTSRSFGGQISEGTGTEAYQVAYQYENHPKANAPGAMQPHKGSAVLHLSADGRYLEGEYYTGRGRTSFGTLTLRREGVAPRAQADQLKALPAPGPEGAIAQDVALEPERRVRS